MSFDKTSHAGQEAQALFARACTRQYLSHIWQADTSGRRRAIDIISSFHGTGAHRPLVAFGFDAESAAARIPLFRMPSPSNSSSSSTHYEFLAFFINFLGHFRAFNRFGGAAASLAGRAGHLPYHKQCMLRPLMPMKFTATFHALTGLFDATRSCEGNAARRMPEIDYCRAAFIGVLGLLYFRVAIVMTALGFDDTTITAQALSY